MSNSTQTPATGSCPILDVLGMAETTAKKELGTTAENKSVSAAVDMKVDVTENGTTKTSEVSASVSLGVKTSETPASK